MSEKLSLAPFAEEDFEDVYRIVNANAEYNLLENGSPHRSRAEVLEQLDPGQTSLTVRLGGSVIGLVQYLEENPKDGYPWLGLLMLDPKTRGQGHGRAAYAAFEALMRQSGKNALRLGVIPQNERAQRFWRAMGFERYDRRMANIGMQVDCFEKRWDLNEAGRQAK